jgi:hypothetical protein
VPDNWTEYPIDANIVKVPDPSPAVMPCMIRVLFIKSFAPAGLTPYKDCTQFVVDPAGNVLPIAVQLIATPGTLVPYLFAAAILTICGLYQFEIYELWEVVAAK